MAACLQFGEFELTGHSGELRRAGAAVRIQEKPLKLLQYLLARPGELVTRTELQKALWPDATFLDFEDGLNTAVRKLRKALGDEAEHPRFVETVPRRGYRWVAEVAAKIEAVAGGAQAGMPAPTPKRRRLWRWAAVAGLVLACGVEWLLRARSVLAFRQHDSILIADMDNQTGEPRLDQALNGALAISLEQSRWVAVFPRDRLASVLPLMDQPADARVTSALGREICLREGIQALVAPGITRAGKQYELTAELIEPATGAVVRSYSERAAGADGILDGLGRIAGEVRRDLGESVIQVRASRPLPEVTTQSLQALQDYANGSQNWGAGHFNQAVALYRAALADDPNFAMAHAALAAADCSYIFYAEAACRAEYARALAPASHLSDREREIIAANFADSTNQAARAAALYEDYLRVYPKDWAMLNDYGHLLRMHGRAAEALDIYRRILQVAPDDARAHVELATADADLGDSNAALAAYRRAFQLDPHWQLAGDINREYGFTLARLGQFQAAAAAFAILLHDPSLRATGMDSLARLDFLEGKLTAARQQELRASAARRDPGPLTPARSHLLLAEIAAAQDDKTAAEREMRASMADFRQLNPKVAWGGLAGREWARLGEPAEAQRILAEIQPLAQEGNLEDQGYVRLLRGEIAVAEGHAAQGIAIFGLPSGEDGDSVHNLTTEALAHAFQRQGDLKQAALWYQRTITPNQALIGWEPQPQGQEAYLELASDELALGDEVAARAALQPLLQQLQAADANYDLRLRVMALAAKLR
ncbi:MAG: winged helix-turn-helix domain-containing protein [Terriglobales bacterium]